jgi:dephospho-CoA kinase
MKEKRRARIVVGLTGGIGSGKSLALSEFDRLGAATISTDQLAREQARPGRPAHRALVRAFGTADRARIAELVFAKPAARRKLESITHPLILRELKAFIAKAKGVVVADVPLLFEKKLQSAFDATVLITAPEALRLKRLKGRGMDSADARRRMRAQLRDAVKVKLADVVIPNAGTKNDFRRRVGQYHQALALMQESPQ